MICFPWGKIVSFYSVGPVMSHTVFFVEKGSPRLMRETITEWENALILAK
jgi:hypothetical protein